MKTRLMQILTFILVAGSFVVAAMVYPSLPERVVSHWNAGGEADGHVGRFWGAFLLPAAMLGMWILFLAVPRLDPKAQNIEKFRKYFDGFILTMMLFFAYIYSLTLTWNFGYRFEMMVWLSPAFAVLFWVMGVMIGRAEPNWTIGIRTPWTLSSETVWRKTHDLGGKLFRAAAVLSLLGVIWPRQGIWFVLVPVLTTIFILFVFSFVEYKRESKLVV